MGSDAKTLDFDRGCNSIQNQSVRFLTVCRFGTVRSVVRIHSPRPFNPISSITYGRQFWRLVFTVAKLWPVLLKRDRFRCLVMKRIWQKPAQKLRSEEV